MILSSIDTEDKQPELEVGDVVNAPANNKVDFYMVVGISDSYGLLDLDSGYIQAVDYSIDGDSINFVDSLSELSGLLGSYAKVSGNFNAYIGE